MRRGWDTAAVPSTISGGRAAERKRRGLFNVSSGAAVPACSWTSYTGSVRPLLAIGTEPLRLEQVAAAVDAGATAGEDGAVVTFLGLVRNHNLGRSVRYLEYEAYEPLALKAFERIAVEIGERWPRARFALHHRIGRLEIGEASVAIATRSPHRGDAYAACRYAIERIKQIAPIWKHEFFDGGDVWIEGATADPEDLQARAEAERIACV
jgi:molybdopterin synthase catalytic subunit